MGDLGQQKIWLNSCPKSPQKIVPTLPKGDFLPQKNDLFYIFLLLSKNLSWTVAQNNGIYFLVNKTLIYSTDFMQKLFISKGIIGAIH